MIVPFPPAPPDEVTLPLPPVLLIRPILEKFTGIDKGRGIVKAGFTEVNCGVGGLADDAVGKDAVE